MSADPYASYVDGPLPPYTRAVEYTDTDIVAGDIDLPFVSSCVRIQDVGPSRLKVTLHSGDVVTFRAYGCQDFDIRAVKIHQEIDDGEFLPPHSVIALW